MITCKISVFSSVLLWTVVAPVLSNSPVVETRNGKIYGRKIKFHHCEIEEYLGIPYARPPIDELRFRKPLPLAGYNEAIIAKTLPPGCMQFSYGPYPWYFEGLRDEDCLYLNIWVPVRSKQPPPRNKTVMFWMHGGGYAVGATRQPLYNSSALACFGDVIVVTINYRLGAFGFLSSGTEDAPGNMGLFDQMEGLKWVNKNIEAFGGNPNSITIFGVSAGATTIAHFSVSPLTKGLYKRVILQSGSNMNPLTDNGRTINLSTGQRLAESLGCADDVHSLATHPTCVVKCLRGINASKLALATANLNPYTTGIFVPQFGDELLPTNPRVAISLLQFHSSEVLIGNTKDEGSPFLTTTFPDLYGFFGNKTNPVNNGMLRDAAKRFLKSVGYKNEDGWVRTVLDTENEDNLDFRHATYTLMGDFRLVCPSVVFAEKLAEKGNRVYYYFFVHRPSRTPWAEWMGTAHYDDVQFVFGNPYLYPRNYTDSERLLSLRVMKIWTNFAKTGKPGEYWPAFSRDNSKFRILNISNSIDDDFGMDLHEKTCSLLRPVLTDLL